MKHPIILAAIAFLASTSTFAIKPSAPRMPSISSTTSEAMGQGRAGAAAVLLYDGRILITGGMTGARASNSAERYSRTIDGFLQTAPMQTGRAHHSSTLLPDGRVLVAGGLGADGRALTTAEIYNPVRNVWTPAPPLHHARAGHTATLLYDGKVLIAGGDDAGADAAAFEMFDPIDVVFVPFLP
jgi:hypothetical protein